MSLDTHTHTHKEKKKKKKKKKSPTGLFIKTSLPVCAENVK